MPRILITTSTGKQGRSTIAALHSLSPTTEILALTRDPTSSTAQSIASTYPSLTLIQGNPTDPEPIFAKAGKVDALCLITVPGKDGDEERQALPMIDAALRYGVGHVVFSSVERGGEKVSEENPTEIEHFASKHRIEKYLRDKLTDKQTTWTILRPVAFMDNLIPGFGAKAFTGLWQTIGPKPLQLISCHDIGHFAALALLSPSTYASRCIGLAGDELNITQARTAFQTALGQPLPETWGFVGQGIKFFGGEFGKMFEWFRTDGYGVDIQALRKEYPALQDFGTWLREDSGFRQ